MTGDIWLQIWLGKEHAREALIGLLPFSGAWSMTLQPSVLVLKLLIISHQLMKLRLWPLKTAKLLDEIWTHSLLKFQCALNHLDEPLTVDIQIRTFLQLFDVDGVFVFQNFGDFLPLFDHLIDQSIIDLVILAVGLTAGVVHKGHLPLQLLHTPLFYF